MQGRSPTLRRTRSNRWMIRLARVSNRAIRRSRCTADISRRVLRTAYHRLVSLRRRRVSDSWRLGPRSTCPLVPIRIRIGQKRPARRRLPGTRRGQRRPGDILPLGPARRATVGNPITAAARTCRKYAYGNGTDQNDQPSNRSPRMHSRCHDLILVRLALPQSMSAIAVVRENTCSADVAFVMGYPLPPITQASWLRTSMR
jgi:hypothetical protein